MLSHVHGLPDHRHLPELSLLRLVIVEVCLDHALHKARAGLSVPALLVREIGIAVHAQDLARNLDHSVKLNGVLCGPDDRQVRRLVDGRIDVDLSGPRVAVRTPRVGRIPSIDDAPVVNVTGPGRVLGPLLPSSRRLVVIVGYPAVYRERPEVVGALVDQVAKRRVPDLHEHVWDAQVLHVLQESLPQLAELRHKSWICRRRDGVHRRVVVRERRGRLWAFKREALLAVAHAALKCRYRDNTRPGRRVVGPRFLLPEALLLLVALGRRIRAPAPRPARSRLRQRRVLIVIRRPYEV